MTGITANEHPTLSIIVPTLNRLSKLRRSIQRIRSNVSVGYELIIVDGGSTDGTREFLARHNRLRVIHEAKREGCTLARDKGFRAATGTYAMWLSDNAYPLPGSVEAAIADLQQDDGIGMVGFYDNCDCGRTIHDSVDRQGRSYRIYNVAGRIYANFGLLLRDAIPNMGHAEGKPGLRVVGCSTAIIHQQPAAKSGRPELRAPLSPEAQEAVSAWNKAPADATPQHASDELQLA